MTGDGHSMPTKRPARKRRRVWRGIAVGGLLLGGLTAGTASWIVYREITANLPPVDKLLHYELPVATRVYADDGTLLGEFYTEKRYLVPIARIPPVVRQAFIAAEDASFYRHKGVDLAGIARAALVNLWKGEVVQGGSTITQQVVKALLLTPEKSYERKAKEVLLALRLERQLTKDEILYLYLNLIYLGNGAYGVGAAAKAYFGKETAELTLAEAALLAGLPQAPSRYSPVRHWSRAKHRQRYVLERMARERFVSWDEAERALREPIHLVRREPRPQTYVAAPYFVEHVRRLLEERYGGTVLTQGGLHVYTTVNLPMQAAAEAALRQHLDAIDQGRTRARPLRRLSDREAERFLAAARAAADATPPRPGRSYRALVLGPAPGGGFRVQVEGSVGRLVGTSEVPLPAGLARNDLLAVRRLAGAGDALEVVADTDPQLEGALVSIELATGHVKALVGGYDFARSQFNRATQALRQPGSAFKPFIYAAALDRGYTTASVLVDEPIVLPGGGRAWIPSNYDNRFVGPITLRDALTFSRNVVTVKLAQNVGLNYLVDYLPRFGFERRFERNLAISLGAAEVTLLELTRAYTVFANQGRRLEPLLITRITDAHGTLIEELTPSSEPVISPETAYLVTSMMRSVVERGTGRRVQALKRPVAGKTGTTNDIHDAWFLGFTPELATGVWVGYDSERSLGRQQTGGRVAAPIFLSYMEAALANTPPSDFPVPEGIVCTGAGDPAAGGAGECFKRGSGGADPFAEDDRFAEEIEDAVERLRLRGIRSLLDADPESPPPGGRYDPERAWTSPAEAGGAEPDPLGRPRFGERGRPRTEDYLPRDDGRRRRSRFGDMDEETYRERLRRRLRGELDEIDDRPPPRRSPVGSRAPEPRSPHGIVEEPLP
jgi:penicillin-binding protein 1A